MGKSREFKKKRIRVNGKSSERQKGPKDRPTHGFSRRKEEKSRNGFVTKCECCPPSMMTVCEAANTHSAGLSDAGEGKDRAGPSRTHRDWLNVSVLPPAGQKSVISRILQSGSQSLLNYSRNRSSCGGRPTTTSKHKF